MPLSVTELKIITQKGLENLYELSGFPEPCFQQSKVKAERWSRQYRERLVRQEISSVEQTQDLGNMEILFHRLPKMVGVALTINSLVEELQIFHKTISKWVDIFEKFYSIFRISPSVLLKFKLYKKSLNSIFMIGI